MDLNNKSREALQNTFDHVKSSDNLDTVTVVSASQLSNTETILTTTTVNTNVNLLNNKDGSVFSFNSFQKVSNAILIKNNVLALVILCMCAFVQNVVVGGANNAILSTIERAFYLSSMESAIFLSIYDVANIIASPIIGYFGDKVQKPAVLSLSMLGLCFGSVITTIPQFLSFDQTQKQTQNQLIDEYYTKTLYYNSSSSEYPKSINNTVCTYQSITQNSMYTHLVNSTAANATMSSKCSDNFLNNLKYFFYLGNIVNGVSSVSLYTIAISYIELMFTKEKTPLCQGVYTAIGAIGIGAGMLLTGNLLNLKTSNNRKHPASASSETNVNFIGAWWILYLITAAFSFILSVILTRFSTDLALRNEPTPSVMHTAPEHQPKNKLKFHVVEFSKNGFKILSNKIFLFIVICATFETLLMKGYSSYLNKFLEYQYRLQASTATMLTGAIGFASLICGVFLGAFLIKKFEWSIKHCIKFTSCIMIISSTLFLGLMIYCPQEKFINGASLSFSDKQYGLDVACNCNANLFNPVCYQEKYLFQTPCHAACEYKDDSNGYSKCYYLNMLDAANLTVGDLTLSKCSRPAKQCMSRLIIVSIVGFLALFMSSLVIIPILKTILECIPSDSTSYALGIRSLVTKLFGQVPGPLIFAAIVDRSCILWIAGSSCTTSRSCRLYDNQQFSLGLGLLGFSIRLVSAFFSFCALYHINRSGHYDIKTDI